MKRVIYLKILILGLSIQTSAKNIKGQIFYENDTVDVVFKIPFKKFISSPNFTKIQKQVTYFDTDGTKKKLKPDDALGYTFKYDGYSTATMVSKDISSKSHTTNRYFLRLHISGKMKLMGLYHPGNGLNDDYYIQKEDQVLQKVRKTGFQAHQFEQEVLDYLSDCPAVNKRLGAHDFTPSDMRIVVALYNTNCS